MKTRHLWLVAATPVLVTCSDPSGAPAASSGPKSSAPTASAVASTVTSAVTSASAAVSASSSASAAAPPATPARPLYYEAPITDADLKDRTLRELALMRNTIYARAGNPFRKPWLDAYFKAQPWYSPKETWDESKITKLDRENSRKIADFDAAISREDLEKRKEEVVARRDAGKATPEDMIELSLLSQRLGVWLGGAGEATPNPLEDVSQLDKLLTVEQLSTLSRRDLRMLRNTIYARRGRPFDSQVVRDYFKGAAWYKPDPSYDDGRLVEVDRKNIAMVRSVEQSLGGPMHENPDYGKDGWFIAA